MHPDFQYLFAFEDLSNKATQLMWTVLPQGFRDVPTCLVLSRDLSDFLFPQVQVLQYVDDLLYSSLEEDYCEETKALLNFLAERRHKAFQNKAQL